MVKQQGDVQIDIKLTQELTGVLIHYQVVVTSGQHVLQWLTKKQPHTPLPGDQANQ